MAEAKRTSGVFTKREMESPSELLKTPHGAIVKVPKRRAKELLSRGEVELPGGKRGKWEVAPTGSVRKVPLSSVPVDERDKD